MKTPIQEAIEKVQSLRQIDAVINPIGVIESILSNMLEKEKEVIMDAYIEASPNLEDIIKEAAEGYYNKTFNTKER
jgi:HEPN domain-containing protein